EHPRTYSLTSFKFIAEALDLSILAAEFPARYGGNIRVMMSRASEGRGSNTDLSAKLAIEEDFEQRLRKMAKRIPAWSQAKRREIQAAVDIHGPLPGKA